MLTRGLAIFLLAVCGLYGPAFAQLATLPYIGVQLSANWQIILVDLVRAPSWCQHLHHPNDDVCGSHQAEPEVKRPGLVKPNDTHNKQTDEGSWHLIKIGNGGLVTGLGIAPDGTKVARTDSYGCYLWNTVQNKWVQLLTYTGMPAGIATLDNAQGCDELQIDPEVTSTLWLQFYGNVYKSTNSGATFSATGFPQQPSGISTACCNSIKQFGPYIAVDPNNSSIVYASTPSQGLYVTTNGGISFSQETSVAAGLSPNVNNGGTPSYAGTDSTNLAIGTGSKSFNNNSTNLGFHIGTYVQVWETSNPANQMFGTVSASSHTKFTLNVTRPQGSGSHSDWTVGFQNTPGGGHAVVFDTSGGTVMVDGQTRTKNVFVTTYGIGVFESTDGGQTFFELNSTGMPTTYRRIAVDRHGVLWMTDDSYGSFNDDKYASGVWSQPNTGYPGQIWYTSVAVDSTQCASEGVCHVVFVEANDEIMSLTTNGGSSWNNSGGTNNRSYVSRDDVDWLGSYFIAQPNAFFANTDAWFDPLNSGRLYTGAEGVWYTTPPSSGVALTLTQQTRGIEEFVQNQIISPDSAGGAVIITTWDFPCFYSSNFDAYPSYIGCAAGPHQANLLRGYSIDWVGSSPSIIVALVQDGTGSGVVGAGLEQSGKSTNGGVAGPSSTWTKFMSAATTANGGCIAAGSTDNIVWISANTGRNLPYLTTNGGRSWATISIQGGTPAQGWGTYAPFADISKMCESDKTNGDIYLYNVNDGAGHDGIYKWDSSNSTWSLQSRPGFAAAYINEQMKSVPGRAGYLFFTGGLDQAPHPANKPFYYTTNGWQTKSTVIGFKEVTAFGFGATFAGHTFPSIYAAGWYNGTYGIWMCKDWDSSQTWQQISDGHPNGIVSAIHDMDGDKVTPGVVYGTSNGGAFWGKF